MSTLLLIIVCLMILASFILGTVATELDLRRNLKRDSSRVPMVFGKDILLEKQGD